ncbi:MAG: ATP-grasp domain-containing protein [Actinomycetota bacterium]|nr:ATP-grasp domain-containing protein [Actinomycetota bacterium]
MGGISRVLIANRGEIAVRIARTATRLGIETVGVYSGPDATALHVGTVDRAVALGGATPATSYLRADAVLAAALDTGCDAVHPGYGFLAENASFARAVLDAGLIWVGPTPEQIELLGDKIAAKAAAVRAGVPTTEVITVEGSVPPDGVTYPALVKAAAGGGGRGMRVVTRAEDLPSALDAARREALAAFGDDTVFIEPFIEHGRHVEVQVFGDVHGNVVHLGDRDCSIQRRNQKVVEEAPAPALSDDVRARLRDGAVALAREVGYVNAGTVEFLVGPDGTVTFLEVNTRLQVEHPVTEAVTGLDLVEWQLRVAEGAPLPLAQDQVTIDGHAIEVRLVAEDPASGWLPSTGTVERFAVPAASSGDGVRCDTGVTSGTEVGAEYDSLLAKVIAHGSDRRNAARVLASALRRSSVVGPRTNLATSVAILDHPAFVDGTPTTRFLDDHPEVLEAQLPDGEDRVASLVAAVLSDEAAARAADPHWGFAPSGWRNLRVQGQRSVWVDERGEHHHAEVLAAEGFVTEASFTVLLGEPPAATEDGSLGPDERRALRVRRLLPLDATTTRLELDGVVSTWTVDHLDGLILTSSAAGTTTWRPLPRFEDHDAAAIGSGPVAPLPGTVVSVHVAADDTVADGDVLVVVEAMKMEHTVRAATAGRVTEVRVAAGDRVEAGELLVVVEPDG